LSGLIADQSTQAQKLFPPPPFFSPHFLLTGNCWGGRQILGSVRVGPERLIAEVKTLSMGARLVGILKGIFGEQIRLTDTSWKGVADLLAERS